MQKIEARVCGHSYWRACASRRLVARISDHVPRCRCHRGTAMLNFLQWRASSYIHDQQSMLQRIRYSHDVTISYDNTNEIHRDNGAKQGGCWCPRFQG